MSKDPESTKQTQEEIKTFYNGQIDLLKLQKEYNQLILDLEEIDLRRLLVKQKVGEIKAPNPQQDDQNFKTGTNGNSESSQKNN